MQARRPLAGLLFLTIAFLLPAQNSKGFFTIAGSGSNIALTQSLLDAYAEKTGIQIYIPPSIGTSGAVKAIQANSLDLGIASRALKDAEKASGIKELAYARLGIIFGVHAGVPDDNISSDDLVAIFKGTKKTWANGKMIIVLAREAGDSSIVVLEGLVPGFKEVFAEAMSKKRWDVFYTDQDEFEATKMTMDSLGLVDTSAILYLASWVKALKFNGVEPSLSNIENGKYHLWKDLTFIYREPLGDGARRFMEFVASEAGTAVLKKNGAIVPARGK